MKSPERVPMLLAVTILFVPGLCLQPVWANIYSYTADDGTLNLCNAPTDNRYSVLVSEPDEEKVTATATGIKDSFNLANKILYDRMVEEVAQTYGLESALLHAVISVESRYKPQAVSKKGAAGLMQLMPSIAKRYGVVDPLDPVQNLHGGAKYLRYLLKKFKNNRSLALAAYNAGESAVAKYGNRIPPYRETTNYVPRVLGFYRKYRVKG